MSVRNENIGIAVSVLMLAIGGMATSWQPSDAAAQAIGAVAFFSGIGLSLFLNERERSSRRR